MMLWYVNGFAKNSEGSEWSCVSGCIDGTVLSSILILR